MTSFVKPSPGLLIVSWNQAHFLFVG